MVYTEDNLYESSIHIRLCYVRKIVVINIRLCKIRNITYTTYICGPFVFIQYVSISTVMESPSDNDPCFNEYSSEDGRDVNEDRLEFCEHCGEIVQRSTQWRHKLSQ